MSLSSTKINLAKKILESNNKYFINYVNSIFESETDYWFQELPKSVQISVKKGILQSDANETIAHKDIMKKYKKWTKK
jgi:hypothetical protein